MIEEKVLTEVELEVLISIFFYFYLCLSASQNDPQKFFSDIVVKRILQFD